MPTSINHLITSSFWLLCGVVGEAARVGHKFTEANVHRLFLFVPSWSMTRMLEACDRDKFDTHLQQYVDGVPQGDTIIEYRVDLKTGNWTALEPDLRRRGSGPTRADREGEGPRGLRPTPPPPPAPSNAGAVARRAPNRSYGLSAP